MRIRPMIDELVFKSDDRVEDSAVSLLALSAAPHPPPETGRTAFFEANQGTAIMNTKGTTRETLASNVAACTEARRARTARGRAR